ncbi:hypothetical protein L2E82_28396 [Cichorium intybus]|uniref:Uncharacterized protein n=1 Tax=Cichorium intybus TaxID=13427 RepID=A0ACB9CVM3_CICIN|nr:hypothetical protein L2E82_28396 [Cichorium intybus]
MYVKCLVKCEDVSLPPDIPRDRIPPPVQDVSPALRGRARRAKVKVTTGVLWKAAAKAASTLRPFSLDSPHALFTFVNLRKRASPPLPNELIGNVISMGTTICFPNKQPDLANLMSEVRNPYPN